MDENQFKNQLFNCAIDNLFNENISFIQLSQILQKQEIINFFLLILNEFSSNPDVIKEIFNNTNPKNKNLNMMFKENATNILEQAKFTNSNYMDNFINYLKFAMDLNNNDLSHLLICYNTCKKMIISLADQNNEKIIVIQKSIMELCFNCPNNFPYVKSVNNNTNYEIKRLFILKESFSLFKCYIKSRNKIHLLHLYKSNIIQLLKTYKSSSYIQLLLLYYIFEQRNSQYSQFENGGQSNFKNDLYKEDIFAYFNFLELYYEFFYIQKNVNFELENILVVLMSQITKQFPEYNLFNYELINKIIKYNEKSDFDNFLQKEFFVENIKIFDEIFFYKNPLKACIIYVNILMFNEKKEIKFDLDNCNYYDLDKLFKCAIDFIENDLKNEINRDNDIIIKEKKYHMMNLFIKTCLIIFIFFSNDLIIFAPVLESDSVKLHKNIFKFFCKLINVLFLLLKNYHQYIKKELKDKLLSIINEVCMSNPLIYFSFLQNYSKFDTELIHFIVDNIPHAINCFKQLTFLYKYEKPIVHEFYLNSLIMFGYLVNKYPLKEQFNNGLDILNCLQKVINLRDLLKTEKNVDKFTLGIYLFYKAFPNSSRNEMKAFINFLSKEMESSYEKKTKEKIDNLCNFIKKEFFMNECYKNKNTQFVDINDFLKDNFN